MNAFCLRISVILLVVFFLSCVNSEHRNSDVQEKMEIFDADSPKVIQYIVSQLNEIDSINHWTHIDTMELFDSVEGGVAEYYYKDNRLQKIIVRSYGEMFQSITSYYTDNQHLLLVIDTLYHYNRPIYYDEDVMNENGDTAFFDMKKSKITLSKAYFDKNILVSYRTDSPHENDSLPNKEQVENTILTKFKELVSYMH